MIKPKLLVVEENLEQQIKELPLLIYETSLKNNEAEVRYLKAKKNLEHYLSKLSIDVTVSPEKHGYPDGVSLSDKKIEAFVKSKAEYINMSAELIQAEASYNEINYFRVALNLKFEAVKCLLNHNLR